MFLLSNTNALATLFNSGIILWDINLSQDPHKSVFFSSHFSFSFSMHYTLKYKHIICFQTARSFLFPDIAKCFIYVSSPTQFLPAWKFSNPTHNYFPLSSNTYCVVGFLETPADYLNPFFTMNPVFRMWSVQLEQYHRIARVSRDLKRS